MRKIYFSLFLFIGIFITTAQNTVTFDANAMDANGNNLNVGFINYFDDGGNGVGDGSFVGSGINAVRSVLDGTERSVELFPHYTPRAGATVAEGNTFREDNSLAGEPLTFTAEVVSNDINGDYTATAFIKAFEPNFQNFTISQIELPSSGEFTVTYDGRPNDAIIQYGFAITGPIAADGDMTGSVVVKSQDNILSTPDFNTSSADEIAVTYGDQSWNFASASQPITNIEVFDLSGRLVMSANPNASDAAINIGSLNTGIYMAAISSRLKRITKKVIKR